VCRETDYGNNWNDPCCCVEQARWLELVLLGHGRGSAEGESGSESSFFRSPFFSPWICDCSQAERVLAIVFVLYNNMDHLNSFCSFSFFVIIFLME